MPIRLSPMSVGRTLAAVILVLLALDVFCVFFLRIYLGHDFVYGLISAFDFDAEGSIPTWFSFLLIMSASVASLFAGFDAAKRNPPLKIYWFVLAGLLCYVSIDEQAQLHEKLMYLIRGRGIFFYSWVLVYGPVVILLGLWFLRFLFKLPWRTSIAFVGAGIIYVTGAVGFELVESKIAESKFHAAITDDAAVHDRELAVDVPYQVAVAFEESFEMTGMLIYLVTLLSYLSQSQASFELSFGGASD